MSTPTLPPPILGGQRTIPECGCPCGKDELFRVPEPDVADLVGTDGIDAPFPEPDGNGRGEILVEVEPHARRGNTFCVARPSACAAVLSAIAVSISSRHFA